MGELCRKPCIYKLNLKDNKNLIYIGSTVDLQQRIWQHNYYLQHAEMTPQHMRCWQGCDKDLEVEVLEQFENVDLIALRKSEQKYIKQYKRDGFTLLNIRKASVYAKVIDSDGTEHILDSIEKISLHSKVPRKVVAKDIENSELNVYLKDGKFSIIEDLIEEDQMGFSLDTIKIIYASLEKDAQNYAISIEDVIAALHLPFDEKINSFWDAPKEIRIDLILKMKKYKEENGHS